MSAWAVEASRGPRGLRPVVLAGAVALLVVVIAVGAWRFVSPPDNASALSAVRLAPASDFAPGSVTGYRITSEGSIASLGEPNGYDAEGVPLGAGFASGKSLFYIVRFPSGDLRVLSGESTHLGEAVLWYPDHEWGDYVGMFYQPGHSERWAIDGTRLFGPQPRDLDRYEWLVDDSGVLVIDLSEVHRGEYRDGRVRPDFLPPLYDVNDPGWPTSGWPDAAVN